jgi:formate dehydrogenase iron-sulfur subunit
MQLSRRNFLKASAGAAGLALLLSPGTVHANNLLNTPSTDQGVGMLIDTSKCVGCWWCYAACKNYNGLPETIRPDAGEPPPLSANVWTTLFTAKPTPGVLLARKQACNHCIDAACVKVCPTGALSYNEMGFVQYDKEKCSGCGYCAEFCPFGVPQMSNYGPVGDAVMDKCTFCIDRVSNGQQPACAEACPTGAIKFGQRPQLVEEGKQRVAELKQKTPDAYLYGEKELEGLHVMYVLDNTPETYGLPSNPEVPAAAQVRDILSWAGVGLTALVILGVGLNYFVARKSIMKNASSNEVK